MPSPPSRTPAKNSPANMSGSSEKKKAKEAKGPMFTKQGLMNRRVAGKKVLHRFTLSVNGSLSCYDEDSKVPIWTIDDVRACALRRDDMDDDAFSLHAAEMTVLLSGQDDSEAEEWISAFIDAGAEVAAESLLPRAPTEEEIQVADQVSADLSVVIDWDQPVHEGLLRQLWDALLTKSVDESSRPPFEHQSVAWQQLLGFDSHDPTTTFNAQSGGGLAGLKWLIWYAEASPSRACASLQRLSEIQRLSQEGSKHSRERLQGPAFGERGLPWACAALQCFLWTCSEFRFIILGSLGVSLGAKRCWGLVSTRERFHLLCATTFECCEREYVKDGAKTSVWGDLFSASTTQLRECFVASKGTANGSLVELRHALNLPPFGYKKA